MRPRSHLAGRTRRIARAALVLLTPCALLVPEHEARAQEVGSTVASRSFASRSTIEQQARVAELAFAEASAPRAKELHRAEAWLLRQRLEKGDFMVGDRIVLAVRNEPTMTDTFTVRPGPVLELSRLPAISLAGVLRSELQQHLTAELGRYMREPVVTAVPLVRVAVMGQVGRPGYYHVPADMLLTDLLMAAGGPGGNADLRRSEIRRGENDLFSSRDVRVALSDGMSLDALSLRSGDEFHLLERRNVDWGSLFRIVTITSGVISLIARFTS